MAPRQQLTDDQEALVARIREETAAVRHLEGELDAARMRRRAAIKAAVDAGVTVYRVAQEAETSHSSAWRIVHDFDEKWAAAFAEQEASTVDATPPTP